MGLALSTQDQSLVATATRALVSPLIAPSFEGWLAEVNHTLKELFGADKASFMFPLPGGRIGTASDEFQSSQMQYYMREKQPEIERRWGVRRRALELGAFTRGTLYAGRLPELYRSDYYNEYLVSHRAYDVLGLSTALDSPERVVNLYLHHERPTGRRFGRRGLAIARMLLPAFKAGVHASHTLFQHRHRLVQLADLMSVGVALADGTGRIVHRNPSLVSLLSPADAAPLNRELASVATECAGVVTGFRGRSAHPISPFFPAGRLRRKLALKGATFTLTASALAREPSAYAASVAVVVERAEHVVFPEGLLRARYDLTPREIEVARFLADGASNAAIANALGISPATARHHTEAVLAKLGVSSRARIPRLLATLGDAPLTAR